MSRVLGILRYVHSVSSVPRGTVTGPTLIWHPWPRAGRCMCGRVNGASAKAVEAANAKIARAVRAVRRREPMRAGLPKIHAGEYGLFLAETATAAARSRTALARVHGDFPQVAAGCALCPILSAPDPNRGRPSIPIRRPPRSPHP